MNRENSFEKVVRSSEKTVGATSSVALRLIKIPSIFNAERVLHLRTSSWNLWNLYLNI